MMEITQKNFAQETKFKFGKESLRYSVKFKSKVLKFTIKYNEISNDIMEYEEKHLSARNFGFVWLLVGVSHVGFQFLQSGKLSGSFWFLIALLCFGIYFLTKTKFTILEAQRHNIHIIKDSNHDRIYNEIFSRRKKMLLSLYGDIDFDNNPDDEINKFLWLKDNNIIDEKQFESIVEKITLYHIDGSDSDSLNEDQAKLIH